MTFDSASLFLRLHTLQQQIDASAQHRTALCAREGADRSAAMCAAIVAEHHVRSIIVTAERIRARVVPADGLGSALGSLSELVLRAVRMVVRSELGTLFQLVGESHADAALMLLAHGELNEITDQWLRWRGTAVTDRGAYRSALREASAALRALGTASEFGDFLDHGLDRVGQPILQTATARILAALTLSINVEPDAPGLIVSWPWPHCGRVTECAS
jgi:hypothetical protein